MLLITKSYRATIFFSAIYFCISSIPRAKKSQRNKKTVTPAVTSTNSTQQQQKRRPSTTPPANPKSSALGPTTCKRSTNDSSVTPSIQSKRPRTVAHPLSMHYIPGIVQAVFNSLPSNMPPSLDHGRTLIGRSSHHEDGAPTTSTSHQNTSEEDDTNGFGTLCCLTWAV